MLLEYNPFLKSPEELDIDFRHELCAKHEIPESIKCAEKFDHDIKQNGSQNKEICTDENEIPGTGLNPKTEILTDRDQDENKETGLVKKKKVPL